MIARVAVLTCEQVEILRKDWLMTYIQFCYKLKYHD